MKKAYIFIALLVIAAGISGLLYKRYRIPPVLDMPALALTDLDGHRVSLQSYYGHPLFINFFATWCGPCMRELPDLAELQNKLAGQKLQVICICDEPVEKLQSLKSRLGDKLIILHSDSSFHDIGVYTYPTNYIFNAKGQKVYEKVNPDDWDNVEVVNKIRHLIE
jgi:thiol-disulfide isomerase/thioredoxin